MNFLSCIEFFHFFVSFCAVRAVCCVCVCCVCVCRLCVLCVLRVLCYFVMCQVASVGAKNVCLAIKEMMTKEMMDCFTVRIFLAYYFNFLTLVFFLIMFRLSTSFQHTI